MDNVAEVASVVKHWLTLKSDITEDERDLYVDLDLEPEIEAAKQGLDSNIETVREQFANLLFSGSWGWLYKQNDELEATLPKWFLPGSDDESYLQRYATVSPTDIQSMLSFLSGLLTMWARGEGRPQLNPDYEEDTWPAGTQYYMYDGTQWLYSPVESGPGADWQTMEARAAAVQSTATPAAVDLGTIEKAQEASHDVAAAAQDILNNILRRNPKAAEGLDPERMKQLVLEALKTQK